MRRLISTCFTVEPFGAWSYFRSFVTVPFENKDPKAIEIIQVVLESVCKRLSL